MSVQSSAVHRVAVLASSDRERKAAIALGVAVFVSLLLHSASLGTVSLLRGSAAVAGTPRSSDIDVDLDVSSDVDTRPNGVEKPGSDAPAAQARESPAPTLAATEDPDAFVPAPSASAVALPATSTPPVVPPPATTPPVGAPPVSAPPASSSPSPPSSAAAPSASAVANNGPPGAGSGSAGTGSSASTPGDAPPGFSPNTPAVTARLVAHFVQANAEGADWATLAAGSEASITAVLDVDAAGKTRCSTDETAPVHLSRALTHACFKLRQEKVALDAKRWGPGQVRVRITASISDVPVPADRPDGIFGLEMTFAKGRGHGAFTQTRGRHVEILMEVERIDDAPR